MEMGRNSSKGECVEGRSESEAIPHSLDVATSFQDLTLFLIADFLDDPVDLLAWMFVSKATRPVAGKKLERAGIKERL
eukprot:scaffold14699_cov170-Amphora_coffeaeformis.AAC.10